MVTNINSDLANGIGNLLSRTLTMIERFSNGTIPAAGTPAIPELEAAIAATATSLPERIDQGYRALAFRENLQAIWELIGLCDEYIDKAAAQRPSVSVCQQASRSHEGDFLGR